MEVDYTDRRIYERRRAMLRRVSWGTMFAILGVLILIKMLLGAG